MCKTLSSYPSSIGTFCLHAHDTAVFVGSASFSRTVLGARPKDLAKVMRLLPPVLRNGGHGALSLSGIEAEGIAQNPTSMPPKCWRLVPISTKERRQGCVANGSWVKNDKLYSEKPSKLDS